MTSEVRQATGSAGPGPGSNAATWGVVLLAHGSQRGADRSECSCSWKHSEAPEWCQRCPSTPQGLQEATDRLQALLGLQGSQVVLSCLEFIQPFPEQAVRLLKERGFRRVAVMPFLLGHGKHATLELDEMLAELRVQSPQLQIYLANGLGAAPQLADLVVRRVLGMRGLLPSPNGGGDTAGVLLVKAGTQTQYDDCLWLEELGRLHTDMEFIDPRSPNEAEEFFTVSINGKEYRFLPQRLDSPLRDGDVVEVAVVMFGGG